ncbi:MAG TPA: O-antigen ligase family protein, partial [Gemmatimonadaceae bacterium]|nr:O-antigen ligase family protein [Gemmatimonadaceae bacterium]
SWRTAVMLLLVVSLFVPLVVGSDFFFPYVVPRNLFFRIVVELAITSLVLALAFGSKALDLRDEPIFWSLAAFVGAITLSAILSPARDHSFFGDFERMGGVWAWLHLFLFFLLLRTLRDKDWTWILNAAVGVSLIVAVIAIGQHTQEVVAARARDGVLNPSAATVGNSGLLAAYLLIAIGVSGYLASTSVRYRLLYLSAAGLNLLAMVYADNRSTILGLVLGSLFGGLIYSLLGTTLRRRWLAPSVVAGVAILISASVVTIRQFPASGLASNLPAVLERMANTNFAGADESRTLQWRAAVEGFKDRPLTGYGPENHNLVWSAHFDPAIYRLDTDVYDRTHNEFLEILATTGLVGTLAFLAIWVAIGATLVRAYRAGRMSAPTLALLAGIQLAYITYLFFWFVDINSTMLWILLAALIASRGTVGSVVLEATDPAALPARRRPMLAFGAVAAFVIVFYAEGFTPYRADRALARIDVPRGPVEGTLSAFDVLTTSEGRQTAHTPLLMAQFVGSLRPQLEELSADPAKRRLLDHALGEAILAFDREIQRDSLNDRLYTHEGQLFATAAQFYGSADYRQRAIDAFHKATDLSPRRLESRLALADLYSSDHDYERAAVVLGDAVKIDPDLGEPRYRLAEAYLGTGHADSALKMLQSSLKLGYVGAPEAYLAMGKRLEFSGKNTTAASLYSNYLEAKYTEAVWDRSQSIDGPVPTADIALAAHLPLLYMRGRDSELAIKSAAALSAFDPSRSNLVDRFVSDVGLRRRAPWLAKNSLLPCNSARIVKGMDSIPANACRVFRGKL